MKKATSQTINVEKLACLSLMSLCVALFALYIYFVSASIVHVVMRKEINHDLIVLNTEISQLESEYIDAQHQVSNEIASLQGYKATPEKIFIDRTQKSLVLSDTGLRQ